jgi:hypothetical protein
MRSAAATFLVIGLVAVPVGAQSRSGRQADRVHGVPPGHLPPPGQCRVWYDGRPPGHQPPPTGCREAERVASRDRYARVIYGGGDDRWDRDRRDRDSRDRPYAVPRRGDVYPDRYPDGRSGYGQDSVPFDNGYRDGYDKGREDARDNDSFDPVRHSRYRSGDRGYNSRYGSKEQYRNVYRDGFEGGYGAGYREQDRYGRDRRDDGRRLSWPF